jgi:DNA-binding response OmpR family regulator
MLMRSILEKDGYDVDDAEDGHRALEILGDDPDYHLVILDLTMPGLDGRQVLDLIRGSVTTSALPVLIRTGTGSDRIEAEMLEAGADDYVAKTMEPERFLARVHAVLRRALL